MHWSAEEVQKQSEEAKNQNEENKVGKDEIADDDKKAVPNISEDEQPGLVTTGEEEDKQREVKMEDTYEEITLEDSKHRSDKRVEVAERAKATKRRVESEAESTNRYKRSTEMEDTEDNRAHGAAMGSNEA